MKDFLNELLSQDSVNKNPFKAFAAYTALKFEEDDKKCADMTTKIETTGKEVIILQDNKLDKNEFHQFLRDYDTFKSQMKVYIIVGTIVINVVFGLLAYVFGIKI